MLKLWYASDVEWGSPNCRTRNVLKRQPHMYWQGTCAATTPDEEHQKAVLCRLLQSGTVDVLSSSSDVA